MPAARPADVAVEPAAGVEHQSADTKAFTMFARVLLPIGYCADTEALLDCLTELAPLGVEDVLLLNVVEVARPVGFASDTFEHLVAWKTSAEKALTGISERIEAAGIRCRWRLEPGKPREEILRIAEEERVALIVMVRYGHGPLRRLLVGSVAGDVAVRAPVPVLLLQPETERKSVDTPGTTPRLHILRRVLLATDVSDGSADALALVKGLKTQVRDVVVVHAAGRRTQGDVSVARERLERIRTELEFLGLSVKTLIVQGDPVKTVGRIAREQDVSLIVIGSKAEGGALRLVPSAVVQQHVRSVLFVPPGD